MFDEIHALRALGQDEARARLGELLNLEGPAPADVLARVGEDRAYARYLVMLRDAPQLRATLIDGVRNGWTPKETPAAAEPHSSVQLAAKATRALARWGKSGFARLDPAAFEARWAACRACPHLTDAPDRIVYQGLRILPSEDQRICAKCGCTAKTKARLSTETCPDADPGDPARNRWGQALGAALG